MGNEHVIPEFLNRFKKLKAKNLEYKVVVQKQDRLSISMTLSKRFIKF